MSIDSHNEQYDNSAIRNKRNKRFVEQFEENCKATQKMPEFTAFSQPANPKGPEVQKGLCCCHKRPSPGRSGNRPAGPRTLQQADHRTALCRSRSVTSRSERTAIWLNRLVGWHGYHPFGTLSDRSATTSISGRAKLCQIAASKIFVSSMAREGWKRPCTCWRALCEGLRSTLG